tara:strand:+ start:359 stop:2122 length:1764 start_codon:yes stop_codon:yes gene_type:complete
MAKAPDFSTTKIDPNAPGLTYQTPKAMPAKQSKLGSLASLVESTAKAAVVFDKSQTMDEADQLGQELSNEYEAMSPTNLNMLENERARLSAMAEANPEDDAIMQELTNITEFLGKARDQGMSPFEYERRVLQKTQDLSAANPAYADAISERVNKTLGNRGINNLMKQDALLYDKQIAAEQSRIEVIDTYLRLKSEYIMNMDLDEKEILYREHKLKDKARRIIKDRVDDGTLLNQENSQNFQDFINANGGVQVVIAEENKNILNNFTNIQSQLMNQEIDFNRAQYLTNLEVIDAKKYLGAIGALPQTDENKLAYTQMEQFIDGLETAQKNKLSGKDFSDFLKERNGIILAQQNFGRLLLGKDRESLELANLEIQQYEFINNKAGLSFAPGEKQLRQQSIINLSIIAGKKFAITNPNFAGYTKNGEMISAGVKELEPVFTAMIKKGQVSDSMLGYYNNLFNTALFHEKNPRDRYEYDTKFLSVINNMNSETFNYMIQESETFMDDAKNELAFYSGAIINDIQTNKLTPADIEFTDEGVFYSTTSQQGGQVAKKLNLLLNLAAKLDGNKSPTKEDALEIIKMLGINNESN